MSDSQSKEFQIGLAISGAISAGAYVAGVFDFLIEALDEWEKQRSNAKIPDHRVGLKVMSGASAGAITAAIGAVCLADADDVIDKTRSKQFYLKRLYDTWVVKPTLSAESKGTLDFLSLTDLDGPPKPDDDFSRSSGIQAPAKGDAAVISSALNARLLDAIAKAAIDVSKPRTSPRAYVSNTLHVYMTLTNLRGVPYVVPFDGGGYHMITHGDRVHYAVKGLGAWSTESAFADADGKRELQAAWLVTGAPNERAQWKDYSICALGSSAFPAGLAPRLIAGTLGQGGTPDEYRRLFPMAELVTDTTIKPNWNELTRQEQPFWFTCADGGIVDNDPFEYARFALKKKDKLDQPLVAEMDKVDRAVIMVSAFPEEKPILRRGEPHSGILSVLKALFPALINQARFKPAELALAADEKHGSRYLIGPSRPVDGKDQRYAIASGLLGGFGGFVARAFRDHDFQLGRRNCQWFLRTSLALPPSNPIIASWAASVERAQFVVADKKAAMADFCLIPLCGTADDEVKQPDWPQISEAEFEALLDRIAQRFDAVTPLLIQQTVGGFLGFLLRLPLMPLVRNIPGLIRDRALNFVRLTILADLVRRNQIQGWDLPSGLGLQPDDARLVLGELLTPQFELRNVQGIVTAMSIVAPDAADATKVEALLQRLEQADGKPFQVWQAPWKDDDGRRLYTLVSRKPGPATNILGGRLGLSLFQPNTDPSGG